MVKITKEKIFAAFRSDTSLFSPDSIIVERESRIVEHETIILTNSFVPTKSIIAKRMNIRADIGANRSRASVDSVILI